MNKCECKECLHYDVCREWNAKFIEHRMKMGEGCVCKNFKPKSLCVELPVRVGDKVYVANFITKEIQEFEVEHIELDKYANWFILDIKNEYTRKYSFERIGTLFFLSREEAEAELKEKECEG